MTFTGKLRGVSVTLWEWSRLETGLYTETPVTVENVLIAPLEDREGEAGTRLFAGADYELYLPRGDAHAWEGNRVTFFGRDHRLYGLRRELMEGLLPLSWNARIRAVPWDLNTPLSFLRVTRKRDAEGYHTETETNLFGEGATIPCKWLGQHGQEEERGDRSSATEPATVWLRWTPGITQQLRVRRTDDERPYEIVSAADVEDRHEWLELRVRRREAAT